MQAWYLQHSAVAVKTKNHLLLFDLFSKVLDYKENKNLQDGFVNQKLLQGNETLIFISHEHEDHFDPAVLNLRHKGMPVRYILPQELDVLLEESKEDIFLQPTQRRKLSDFTVTALESTDVGLAYLIEVDGKIVYHAGDLNCWQWEGEEEFNRSQKIRYQEQMKILQKILMHKQIDLAFVPVDPRMETEHRFDGLCTFMDYVDAKVIVPIHLWGDFSIADQIKERAKEDARFDRVIPITKRGQICFESKD